MQNCIQSIGFKQGLPEVSVKVLCPDLNSMLDPSSTGR